MSKTNLIRAYGFDEDRSWASWICAWSKSSEWRNFWTAVQSCLNGYSNEPFSSCELRTFYQKKAEGKQFTIHSVSLVKENQKAIDELRECVNSWHDTAEQKKIKEKEKHFNTLSRVCIFLLIDLIAKDEKWEALICKDNEEVIQGISVINYLEQGLKVEELVVSPDSLSSEINIVNPRRATKVGSSLIYAIFQRAIEQKVKTVELESVPTALGFYQKLGFTKKTNRMMEANADQIQKSVDRLSTTLKNRVDISLPITPSEVAPKL